MNEVEDDMPGTRVDWMSICDEVVHEDVLQHMDGSVVRDPQAVYSGSPMYRDNLLLKETFELAVNTIKYVDVLGSRRRWLIEQFESSACSSGANSKEAQKAESLKDFIHKLKIALKEADEAEYWYYVIAATHANGTDLDLIARIQRVMRILNKIISTSKQRLLERKRPSPPSANSPIS